MGSLNALIILTKTRFTRLKERNKNGEYESRYCDAGG
jgi:hypothetical protein